MFWYWFADLYCVAEPGPAGKHLYDHPTCQCYEVCVSHMEWKTNDRWELRGL